MKTPGNKRKSKILSITESPGSGKIMVWAGFNLFACSDLVFIEENMDGELYIEVLKKGLISLFDRIQIPKDNIIFQEDNDKKPKSKIVMRCKRKQKVNVMEWPSNNPDLNPIENMWAILKERMGKYRLTTIDELKDQLLIEWKKIGADYDLRDHLIRSMHKRCYHVIKKKGERIKY